MQIFVAVYPVRVSAVDYFNVVAFISLQISVAAMTDTYVPKPKICGPNL